MREFIYYSKTARTTGNFDTSNLMKAGRMDIACQIVIMSFFLSHKKRDDVKLHLIFDGPPDSPKHLEICSMEMNEKDSIHISKKDVAGLIKRMLYKYKKDKKNEVSPGYFIEKKSFERLVDEKIEEGKEIFLLDKKGEALREVGEEKLKDAVFILGDQDGLPKDKLKRLKKSGVNKISVGPKMYFASQVMTIIQNEIDILGI